MDKQNLFDRKSVTGLNPPRRGKVRDTYELPPLLVKGGPPLLLVVASDDGPGISDVLRAAIDAPSGSGGVKGLRAMKRLVDEFEIESGAGQGTRVAVKKWKT